MMPEKLVPSSSYPSIHTITDVLVHFPGSTHLNIPPPRPIYDPMLGYLDHRYIPASPLVAKDVIPDTKLHSASLEKEAPSLGVPGSSILSEFAAKQLLSGGVIERDDITATASLEHTQPLSGSHPELNFISQDMKHIEWPICKYVSFVGTALWCPCHSYIERCFILTTHPFLPSALIDQSNTTYLKHMTLKHGNVNFR